MSIRKCPVCGCENAESDFFCRNCGIEISLAEAAKSRTAPKASAPPPARAQRLCPKCGQANDPVFLLCTGCGSDLAAAAAALKGPGRLFLAAGGERFECKDGDVFGRDGTVARSFFGATGTVSRRHATVTQRNGRWFLTVPSTVQNITELDGREIPRDVEQPLSGEHRLKLSTQCEVRLQVADA